jgi:hypothetical protein
MIKSKKIDMIITFDILKLRIDALFDVYGRTLEFSTEQINKTVKNSMKFNLYFNNKNQVNYNIKSMVIGDHDK